MKIMRMVFHIYQKKISYDKDDDKNEERSIKV